MLTYAVGRFRLVSLLEGCSFLVLLFIAMPLKYMGHWPLPVQVVGGLHGALFILYMVTLLQAWMSARWTLKRVGGAVIAAFLPFGTFILDSWIRRDS